jgi:membrane-bound lytic murein transglycosylase F
MYKKNLPSITLFFLCAILLSSCFKPPTALQQVLNRGELIVLTRLDPTTYLIDADGAKGFEYELATLFAEKLGVKARFILPEQFHDILKLDPDHEADFAAAGLSVTPQRESFLHFTPPYYEVTQQVIYHYRTRRPKSQEHMNSNFFEVIAGSSHAENLRRLSKENPSLSWDEADNTNVFELVSLVNDGLLDYTVADSNQFQTYRSQFPKLNAAFNIAEPEKIAWAFPVSDDNSLYDEAVLFLAELKASGVLNQLQDKHFGYAKNLNYVSVCTFTRHLKQRLPKLQDAFHLAAEKYNLDLKLLMAVAYQESHWNPQAISPTGVRGVMMLTNSTAKQMGISDRLDPAQSIDGGAHYLSTRLKRIPERITEPDKTWMALASYNIGFGHLEDARVLTQQQGGDQDKWADVKQRLPLLAQKKWYKKTKYGYARGKEPVHYVKNVQQYIGLLNLYAFPTTKPLSQDEINSGEALKINIPAL